jgi:thymidylate synthase (FAD)
MRTIISVLDHGYVTLLNIAGPTRRADQEYDADDIDPANSARMSFDQRDAGRTREMDLKLCRYLMEHRHTTPFEMTQIWLEMKLPIFVARQFVRHRTVSINEVSARYTPLPAEWYIPEACNITTKAKSNKQGRSQEQYEHAEAFRVLLDQDCRSAYANYTRFIEERVAPELCRLFLHVNHYTKWLWRQDLHNLLHFISLREDAHAQWEAQQYAKAVKELVRDILPETIALYESMR